jgi:gamma-D-glutamyl-L-lysine dipeptidyl-peptidase
VYLEPRIPSPQITQIVLGSRVDLISREGVWWRIRGEDGYIGWLHSGYLAFGPAEWVRAWERAEIGEPVVSLGAELVDEDGRIITRLPWGARLLRYSHDTYALADGTRAQLGLGEIVPVDRLFDRFPPRGDSVTRTARRWLGCAYLWGGVTMAGVDCSGLTQSVLWMHGVALPRDSDLQARVGERIVSDGDFSSFAPGDLLFFAETEERISHVAISLGGSAIIHSSLTNAIVAINDLEGDADFEARLRAMFSHAQRLLPDADPGSL